MWAVFQDIILILIVLTVVTQIILPLVFDKPIFFLFRKSQKVEHELEDMFDEAIKNSGVKFDEASEQMTEAERDIEEKVRKVNELKSKTKK